VTDEDQATGEDGSIGASQVGTAVVFKLDLNFKDTMHEKLVRALTSVMTVLKGEAEVTGDRWRIFELAAAVQAYASKDGHFPRGALLRTPSSERVIDWRPDQRLSWLVELLPFLGSGDYQDLFNEIERDKSWNEGKNLFIAQVPIPQFLAQGRTGFRANYVTYPGHPGQKPNLAATTSYVGIAGVGLDAAGYDNQNPKRGVFGYDRETAVKDIKDGPEQTIVLIQVPGNEGTPWLAGGGSTVRGVSEDIDCVRPFVCTEYQGKKGTFAVMADGKVRFIPANIRPEDFRALCTIAGNDRLRGIDKIAPEVPPEEAPSELKTAPAGTLPLDKPGPAAQVPAPPPEKQAGPAGWKVFTSKEGGYSVLLPPGKAIQSTQKSQIPGAAHEIHLNGVQLADGTTFVVSYSDVPPSVMQGGAEAVLDQARKGLETLLKGAKITNETPVKVEGHPGRDFTVDLAGTGTMKKRIIVLPNRGYNLAATGPAASDKDIQAFFDSFKLAK
jgi:hypothetical protein